MGLLLLPNQKWAKLVGNYQQWSLVTHMGAFLEPTERLCVHVNLAQDSLSSVSGISCRLLHGENVHEIQGLSKYIIEVFLFPQGL